MKSSLKIVNLKEYSDKRGSLVENTLEEIMIKSHHFFVSKSKPGIIRANHYHHRKSEWFYLIQGKCLLKTKDLRTERVEEIEISADQHIMINITPNIAHAFKNTGLEEMILLALVNEVHHQEDPDTIYYKLI